jgi:glycosyltransferase involved in cell wall biosynthesis
MTSQLCDGRRSVATKPTPQRRPKVSVCIPAYQAERHLRATIDSVLAQTYRDLEILIVDNNSSDGTRAIVEAVNDDRVRVLRNAITLPIFESFNLAVHQSRGDYVKLLCADDTLEPDCIEAQAEVLQDRRDVALVAVRTDYIDDYGRVLRRARGLTGIAGCHSRSSVVRTIVRNGGNPIGPPVVGMFRRADFDRCGGFRGDLLFPMELELWTRLLRHGDFYGLARTLASFRISSDSMTALTSARSQLAEQIELTKRLIDDDPDGVGIHDRVVGRANCYVMQLRRTAPYLVSRLRGAPRSRHWINHTRSDLTNEPINSNLGEAVHRSEGNVRKGRQ